MLLNKRTTSFFSLTLILLLLFINTSYAGPIVKLCIDNDCRKPVHITITDNCWSDIKEIFSLPFPTDKDEQDNIINSIALIEKDVYQTLANQTPNTNNANDIYAGNSTKNIYRNTKIYIGVLLDNFLVTRHIVRKSITQHSWAGFENNGLLLQSLTDSKLYILDSNTGQLGASGSIRAYKAASNINIGIGNDKNVNTLDDEIFE